MAGELIVYDVDADYAYERIKIGDGTTNINSLPFVDDALRATLVALINAVDDKVDAVSTLVGDTSVSAQITNAISGKSDVGHTHDDVYYTETEVDAKLGEINAAIGEIVDGSSVIAEATHASSADTAAHATSANTATHADSATTADSAIKATQDGSGQVITDTYETKADAAAKLTAAKAYTDAELDRLVGDVAVSEQISEAIAAKADVEHTHLEYVENSTTSTGVVIESGSGQPMKFVNGSITASVENNTKAFVVANSSTRAGAIFIQPDDTGNIIEIASKEGDLEISNRSTSGDIKLIGVKTPTADNEAANKLYVDTTIAAIPTPDVSGQIASHNTSETAHSDIRTSVNNLSTLVGDTAVSEQIANSQIVYVGPTEPTDPNIQVWINTAEESAGIIPVLPRIATITLDVNSWSGSSAPYYQTVSIDTVTAATKVELNPNVSQILSLQNDDIALMAENDGTGVIKIYSFGGKPSSTMTMQCTLMEVSYL